MNRKELCTKLKNARIEINIKQETVSKALGIPISAVSAMESGTRKVDVLELDILAKLYGKKIEWFFDSENEEYVKSCYNKNITLTEAYKLLEKASPELQTAVAYAIIGLLKEGKLVK